MKQLRVLLLTPGRDASLSQGYPPAVCSEASFKVVYFLCQCCFQNSLFLKASGFAFDKAVPDPLRVATSEMRVSDGFRWFETDVFVYHEIK